MDVESDSDTRLQHQLDVQLHQINRVMSSHHLAASINSGEVYRHVVNFDLQDLVASGIEKLRTLKRDLAAALGTGGVQVVREADRWKLQVPRLDNPPVALLRLHRLGVSLPSHTAMIGLSDGGIPVLMGFSSGRFGHVLVAGDPRAGKTSLLRAIAVSLALGNRQSTLQLQLMDCRPDQNGGTRRPESALVPLGYLPHSLTYPSIGTKQCAEITHFLKEEMAYRRQGRVSKPRIVCFIDNVDDLLEYDDSSAGGDLYRLLQYGPKSGIHLVMSTESADSPLFEPMLNASITIRIIGRIEDPVAARKLSGAGADQASLLNGEGDFLSVVENTVTYFQAAFIGDYDLHLALSEMQSRPMPRLLARPFDSRPMMASSQDPENHSPRKFSMGNGSVELE